MWSRVIYQVKRLTVGGNEQCVVNRQRRGPQRRCRRQPPQCRAIRGMEYPWFLSGPVRVDTVHLTQSRRHCQTGGLWQ